MNQMFVPNQRIQSGQNHKQIFLRPLITNPLRLKSLIVYNLKAQERHTHTYTPPPSYPIFWPDRDRILTEDNLISVPERREAKHWPVFVTPAQMVNYMISGSGFYTCVRVYVQEVSE